MRDGKVYEGGKGNEMRMNLTFLKGELFWKEILLSFIRIGIGHRDDGLCAIFWKRRWGLFRAFAFLVVVHGRAIMYL
jgi:hypothetical protein